MLVRFARYLYVPDDTPHIPSSAIRSLQEALCDHGFAALPSGDGSDWKPFRPQGPLLDYADELDLVMPTLAIEWHPEPDAIIDPFLPAGGDYSRCPTCQKLMPTNGSIIPHPVSGELIRIPIEQCIGCGERFEGWEKTSERVVFKSACHVALLGDGFAGTLPTLKERLPDLIEVVEAVLETRVREVFVAW